MSSLHGPVIFDLAGKELDKEEREILQHPLIGGIILFSRNYESPEQIAQLCLEIRSTRSQPLLITVDHEGGRVQRFREGFTSLPPMGNLGKLFESNSELALQLAETCGWIMASELLAVGIDLSFAPVLDLNKGLNSVIGDRAFHKQPQIVIALAKATIQGMLTAGMAATGKHFPGHGSVTLDSHLALPIDNRCWEEVVGGDLLPFAELITSGLSAIMPAHILFKAIDDQPVGFSKFWLQDILRKQLNFSGMIFSDDLNMEGAKIAGSYSDRAQAALEAGCDMVLICNNRVGAITILDQLPHRFGVNENKFNLLRGQFTQTFSGLRQSQEWQKRQVLLSQTRNDYEYN